ncbi:MAG: hypothetical protein ACK40L_14630, partial [Hydrogenophaga sp.]
MPITEATDQPRKTNVIALPRWDEGTSRPMLVAACGVKMAGEITASGGKAEGIGLDIRDRAAVSAAFDRL